MYFDKAHVFVTKTKKNAHTKSTQFNDNERPKSPLQYAIMQAQLRGGLILPSQQETIQ